MTFDLSSLGWDEHFRSAYVRHDRPDHEPARVIRVDRGICTLLGADGTRRASIGGALLAAAAHDPTRLPCSGDWIVLRTWPDERLTIEAVLPRRTAVIRASAGAEALGQILVANVDTVAAVVPVDPEPDLGLVERLLALAWESGARPVVALTKVDLAAHPEMIVEEVGEIAPGVEVFGVSAATGAGLDQLRAMAGVRDARSDCSEHPARENPLCQRARRGDRDADPTDPPRRWSRPAHDHPSRPDPAARWWCGHRHSGYPRRRAVRRHRRSRPYLC